MFAKSFENFPYSVAFFFNLSPSYAHLLKCSAIHGRFDERTRFVRRGAYLSTTLWNRVLQTNHISFGSSNSTRSPQHWDAMSFRQSLHVTFFNFLYVTVLWWIVRLSGPYIFKQTVKSVISSFICPFTWCPILRTRIKNNFQLQLYLLKKRSTFNNVVPISFLSLSAIPAFLLIHKLQGCTFSVISFVSEITAITEITELER